MERSYKIKNVEDFENVLLSYGIGIEEKDKEIVRKLLERGKTECVNKILEDVAKIVESYRIIKVLLHSQITYPSLASPFGERPRLNRIEADKLKEPPIVGYLHFRENEYPFWSIEWTYSEFKKIASLWKR